MNLTSILYVEDEPDIRRVVTLLLDAQGFHVTAFESGKLAVDYAANEQPDLLLLDLMLNDFSGDEVLVQIRRQPLNQDVPCIFLTAKVDLATRERLSGFGRCDLIRKPFNPNDFVNTIRAKFQNLVKVESSEQASS